MATKDWDDKLAKPAGDGRLSIADPEATTASDVSIAFLMCSLLAQFVILGV
jgi:hypothetical protein